MDQFHPDNFCDPASDKYRDKYAEIARRPTRAELDASWTYARRRGIRFETATFECRGYEGWPRGSPCDVDSAQPNWQPQRVTGRPVLNDANIGVEQVPTSPICYQ